MSVQEHNGHRIERFCEVAELFMDHPRTVIELARALGLGKPTSAYRYVNALRGRPAPLIYVSGWVGKRGFPTARYSWQPSPGFHPDMPKPMPLDVKRAAREAARRVARKAKAQAGGEPAPTTPVSGGKPPTLQVAHTTPGRGVSA